ncbi:MAG TPA: flagellar hook-basal body complex protein FliE [Acetobacteraceae bacterium]|nr:flagellar hook-basal body complex protein FliE [Acetobacteraceae bacterium]
MSAIPTIIVTPSAAADAYARVDRGDGASSSGEAGGFGAMLQRALDGVVETMRASDAKTTEALTGGGTLTEVVTALARAELTLQTATTVRDRVVQAYQDIMKMPI